MSAVTDGAARHPYLAKNSLRVLAILAFALPAHGHANDKNLRGPCSGQVDCKC